MGIMEDVLEAMRTIQAQPPPPSRIRMAPDLWDRLVRQSAAVETNALLARLRPALGIPVLIDDTLPPGQFKLVYPGDDEEDPPSG